MAESDRFGNHYQESLEAALRIAPDHLPAYQDLAKLLLRSKFNESASLRKAAYFARLALDGSKDPVAIAEFEKLEAEIESRRMSSALEQQLEFLLAKNRESRRDGSTALASSLAQDAIICHGLIAMQQGALAGEPPETIQDCLSGEIPPITLVPAGAVWTFLDTNLPPAENWLDAAFDDRSWRRGAAQLGFGGNGEVTEIDRPDPFASTYYFRHQFEFSDAALRDGRFRALALRIKRDDGAVVYLNGKELVRSNMPVGMIAYDTPAEKIVGGQAENKWFEYQLESNGLREGTNQLAIEAHQKHQPQKPSSDLTLDLELTWVAAVEGYLASLDDDTIQSALVRLSSALPEPRRAESLRTWQSALLDREAPGSYPTNSNFKREC